MKNFETNYSFTRTLGTTIPLGDTATTNCLVPPTSYANPIKSQSKFNIESLAPSNLQMPNGNPNDAPTGGIFTIPGY